MIFPCSSQAAHAPDHKPHHPPPIFCSPHAQLLMRSGWVGGAILADEMGLGKTAQTITYLGVLQHQARKAWEAARAAAGPMAAASGRLRNQAPKPHLIVCPASLLENWQRELARCGPGASLCALSAGARKCMHCLRLWSHMP